MSGHSHSYKLKPQNANGHFWVTLSISTRNPSPKFLKRCQMPPDVVKPEKYLPEMSNKTFATPATSETELQKLGFGVQNLVFILRFCKESAA